jgi:hypothetical protein
MRPRSYPRQIDEEYYKRPRFFSPRHGFSIQLVRENPPRKYPEKTKLNPEDALASGRRGKGREVRTIGEKRREEPPS